MSGNNPLGQPRATQSTRVLQPAARASSQSAVQPAAQNAQPAAQPAAQPTAQPGLSQGQPRTTQAPVRSQDEINKENFIIFH